VLQSFGDARWDVARKWHGSGWTPMGRMGTPADIGNAVGCCARRLELDHATHIRGGGASLVDTLLALRISRG